MKLRTVCLSVILVCLLASSAYAIQSGAVEVAYRDSTGHDRIYAFAEGNNGHLVVNYWDGFNWNWADLGLPYLANGIDSLSAITYKDAAGNQHIYVFGVLKGFTRHVMAVYCG